MAKYTGRRHGRLGAILLLLISLTVFLWWSNRSLQVESFTFSSPRLPKGFDGFRAVVLTDLHGAEFGEDNRRLLEKVQKEEPEAIFLTGDLLDTLRETPHQYAAQLCAQCAAIAPTYVVTGNHEWALPDPRGLKRLIRASGATLLDNKYVELHRGGDTILLAGIDDPNGFLGQKSPQRLAQELYDQYQDPFWILLAHRNNRFPTEYSLLGADLVVSGHAHGGIIRLPFTDGLYSRGGWFPSYTAGFYQENGSTLFVSRGLGNSGRSLRLFNRPQVAVLSFAREG